MNAQFHKEFTSVGRENEFKVIGVPLPPWEDLKHTKTGEVHKRFIDKHKRNKEVISAIPKSKCIRVKLPNGNIIYCLLRCTGPNQIVREGPQNEKKSLCMNANQIPQLNQ